MDPPPINGLDVLKILQKQYFLSPDELKKSLHMLLCEVEQINAARELAASTMKT
jgi:hypothetical protein